MDINQHFNEQLQQQLKEREAAGLLRTMVCPDQLVDFCSNDYLGFSKLAELQPAVFTSNVGLQAGATGSRLISGNSKLAEITEQVIAQYHQADAALIFNSGYDANLGLISCLAAKNDTIITDEWVHASIIDGARLSYANRFKFRHNNVVDLEKKLQAATGNKFVVVESVYSMDGDIAPLEAIAALCKKNAAMLIVDEAHATGVYGSRGEGLVGHYGLEQQVFARVITFGKALGLHGAAVLGTSSLRSYLVNHARSFIYTTALPPIVYQQIQAAYQLLPSANRNTLFQLVDHFKQQAYKLQTLTFTKSLSPIQGLIIGDNEKATALSNQLMKKGFFVTAIRSPTVAKGSERLRICLHAFNTTNEIDELLKAIEDAQ